MEYTNEQVRIVELALVARISMLKEAYAKDGDPVLLKSIEDTKKTLEETKNYWR